MRCPKLRRGGLAVAVTLAVSTGAQSTATALTTRNVAESPTAGPAGTVVTLSGSGCMPGPVVSASADYVQLVSTVIVTKHVPVTAAGTWTTTITVAGLALPIPTPIEAACFTDGLPSLDTQYLPAVFTVTSGSSATTTPPAPPTTPSSTPATNPPGKPPATNPPGDHGGDGAAAPHAGGGQPGIGGDRAAAPGHNRETTTTYPGEAVDPLAVGLDATNGSAPGVGGLSSVWWALALVGAAAGGGIAWLVAWRRRNALADEDVSP